MRKSNNEGTLIEMPEFKCHKKVHALKIKEVKKGRKTILVPENEKYAEFKVSDEYVKRHNPVSGGYYVVYKGGYQSFSPEEDFEGGYTSTEKKAKSLGNTDINGASKNVSDLVVFGNGDMFKLLSKASSKAEGWMKSTKAMEIEGKGCVIQITTQQGDNVAEAVTFVPGVKIVENRNQSNKILGRYLA